MAPKIWRALSDSYEMLNEFDDRLKSLKKIINSCHTLKELESCRGIVTAIDNQINNSIDNYLEINKVVNFISFGEFENFLRQKLYEKMNETHRFYEEKILNEMRVEQLNEKE